MCPTSMNTPSSANEKVQLQVGQQKEQKYYSSIISHSSGQTQTNTAT